MFKGKLEWFFEQGSVMTSLIFYEDGKEGYDALKNITEEHYIKIYNKQDKLVYEGEIIKDDFSGYKAFFNSNYGRLVSNDVQVDWLQYGIEPDVWGSYFIKSYRAELYPSKIKNKEKYKKKLLKKVEKKYNEEKKYHKTLLNKTRIVLESKNNLFEQLFNAQKRYQIFNTEYHTLLIESYKKEKYLGKKLNKINKLKKSEAVLIDIDLPIEFEKVRKFENFKNRYDVPFFVELKLMEMEKKKVSKKDIQKFKNKYIKLQKESEKAKNIIQKELYKKINKVEEKVLVEEIETENYYNKETNIVKLISFPKKITKYLKM